MPLSLPSIQDPGETALVPIVSSARALDLICRKWTKRGYRPDAVVLEGPLAGGHLGFKLDEIHLESNRLENLLPEVKDMAVRHGDFPVIVAGGIYSREDILTYLKMGADGVQMGTRFLVTEESSASDLYKQAVIDSTQEDIFPTQNPGSPCGLPFMVLRQAPMFASILKNNRIPKCDKGYLITNGSKCLASGGNGEHFCICNGLLSSAGYNPEKEEPLYTSGVNGYRVDRILSVKTLMEELAGSSPVQ